MEIEDSTTNIEIYDSYYCLMIAISCDKTPLKLLDGTWKVYL
ncbi:hypothetical protein ACWN8K_01080 [Pseudolactococcus piscium]